MGCNDRRRRRGSMVGGSIWHLLLVQGKGQGIVTKADSKVLCLTWSDFTLVPKKKNHSIPSIKYKDGIISSLKSMIRVYLIVFYSPTRRTLN